MDEPVADAVRGILDGHVVLTRELASRGHHPAIDVLQSTSRLMSHVAATKDQELAREARRLLAVYEGSRDLIELGAHQRGANPALDVAIDLKPALDKLLVQTPEISSRRSEALRLLQQAVTKPEVRA
jgi:flagellum-specific ATP synthase